MLAIVRIALNKPYTFVVMAMLIVIFGVAAAVRTPTDIFPNIGIPVVAVVWTYNGLPPDDMSGRVIYYYERTLSAQVNDIEHIESQSLRRLRHRQGVFPAERQHQRGSRADYRRLADRSQAPAAGHHAALRSELQRIQRSYPATRACRASRFRRPRFSTPDRISSVRNWRPSPAPPFPRPTAAKCCRCRSIINQDKLQAYGLSSQDVVEAIARQNLITPGRDGESWLVRIYREFERLAEADLGA